MEQKLNFKTIFDTSKAANFIAQSIIHRLGMGERVLWFLPGGSAIKVAVDAASQIAAHDHHNLTITLTDERYGAIGHQDSNWRQLQAAGLSLPQAQLIPVLSEQGFSETAVSWAMNLELAIKSADYIIGLFGIGADGHTAGILPGSPAVAEIKLVCAYDAGSFKRITITPKLISHLDEAIIFALGEAKWPPIRSLLNENLKLDIQPAQVLKMIKKITIFSDYENSN